MLSQSIASSDWAPPFSQERGIVAIFSAWVIAQLLKVIAGIIRDKKFNFRWLLMSGGMPSSHSAAVSSLSTVVGLYYGFNTIFFWMAYVFSLIIMFDAAGVRRAVGRQASILNKMMDEISQGDEIRDKRLKELLGHTPVEVIAGACLGIGLTFIICFAL